MTSSPPTLTPARRTAYSLIELVLAMSVIALLLIGAQSAVMLASRALPDPNSTHARRLATAQAIDLIAADLADAVTISKSTDREIEFTVPDRDGDGQPETISYSFSTSTSASLKRTYNKSSPQNLLRRIESFSVSYATRDAPDPANPVEGIETLLASNDTGLNLTPAAIDASNWIATSFRPALPADAASWTLTRVKLRLRASGTETAGKVLVQVRPAVADCPTASVLDQVPILESSLTPTFAWQEFAFTKSPCFNPGDSAAVVVQWASGVQACDVEYQNGAAALGNAALATTINGGSSWTPDTADALCFYAYGKIASPAAPTYSKVLTWVRVAIEFEPGSRLDRAVRIPNQPTVILP
jgi:hypothetical protein